MLLLPALLSCFFLSTSGTTDLICGASPRRFALQKHLPCHVGFRRKEPSLPFQLHHQMFDGGVAVHIDHVKPPVRTLAHGGLALVARCGGQVEKVMPGAALVVRSCQSATGVLL